MPHPPGASAIMPGTAFHISSLFATEPSEPGALAAIRAANPNHSAATATSVAAAKAGIQFDFSRSLRDSPPATMATPATSATKPPREKVCTNPYPIATAAAAQLHPIHLRFERIIAAKSSTRTNARIAAALLGLSKPKSHLRMPL